MDNPNVMARCKIAAILDVKHAIQIFPVQEFKDPKPSNSEIIRDLDAVLPLHVELKPWSDVRVYVSPGRNWNDFLQMGQNDVCTGRKL